MSDERSRPVKNGAVRRLARLGGCHSGEHTGRRNWRRGGRWSEAAAPKPQPPARSVPGGGTYDPRLVQAVEAHCAFGENLALDFG